MKKLVTLGVSLLLIAATWSALQEGPAAVLVKVEGDVTVQLGGGDPQPAAVGTRLAVGDRIMPRGGRAVLVHRTGTTQQITEAFTIEAPEGGGDQSGVFSRTVTVLAQAATTDARTQPNRQGMIRPIPGEPTPLYPRLKTPIRGDRPTFMWRSVPSATGYTIQIRKIGSRPVRFSTESADTTWSYPEDADVLTPGTEYWWTVAPAGSGRAAKEATFLVVDAEIHASLDASLTALADAGLDPMGDGLFVAAALYRDAGLMYDALEALMSLQEAQEPMGPGAYLLMGEVMDALGMVDEAAVAFDHADRLLR